MLHHISDAPTTVTGYDVTIVQPDGTVGLRGWRVGGGPDYGYALKSQRQRKEQRGRAVEDLGVKFVPLCFTTNVNPFAGTEKALRDVAAAWARAHGTTRGNALQVLRRMVSGAIHRWNGVILQSVCRQAEGNGDGTEEGYDSRVAGRGERDGGGVGDGGFGEEGSGDDEEGVPVWGGVGAGGGAAHGDGAQGGEGPCAVGRCADGAEQ
jgi:hypothetical protein